MRILRTTAYTPMLVLGLLAGCNAQEDAITSAVQANHGRGKPVPCEPATAVSAMNVTEECVVPGRMTGGGNSVTINDVKVTKGLTLHCDITLSNNLEVNWPGGNNWHLTKPIETADCVDDPTINPEPPPAPFDTFNGTATGSLNGVDGSFIEFTFIDAGEPGGENDMVSLRIHTGDASTPLALDMPLQFTTGGNLQAHFDQPHK